jgi:hypothetical protein
MVVEAFAALQGQIPDGLNVEVQGLAELSLHALRLSPAARPAPLDSAHPTFARSCHVF